VFHRTLLVLSGDEMFGALDSVVAEVLSGRTRSRAHARRAMEAILEEAVTAMLGEITTR